MRNDRLESALRLAEMGFWIFPLRSGSKLPAHKGWQDLATRDPDTIKAWFTSHAYNVGIFTSRFGDGKALLVIDVDNKEGKKGDEELLRLELEGKDIPVTFTQRTPTGGQHLVYVVDEPVKQGANVFAPGLDVRSAGGYIVGAGSVVGNGIYTADNYPLAPAPQWAIDFCGRAVARPEPADIDLSRVDPVRANKRAIEYLQVAPVSVEGEAGDQTAYIVACRVKDFGVDHDTCFELLSEHWNGRCAPPWPEDELLDKVTNAYRYGTEAPGAAAPEAQFPPVQEPEAARCTDGRILVQYRPEHLADAGQLIERAMLEDSAHESLLTYEGRYVSIRHSQPITAIQRLRGAKGCAYIHAHDNESLRARVMESAKIFVWKSGGKNGVWAPARCPDELVAHLQSSAKRSVPALTGIITAPTILPDGSTIWIPGYHEASGLYADFDPESFPAIATKPTQQDAREARCWLHEELFGEAAFEGDADADVAISALLTGCVRRFLSSAPAFLYVSAQPGSGKTTIMEVITIATTGSLPPQRAWPSDDEEMNKTIITALSAGYLTLDFDNLPRGQVIGKQASLAALLTSETYGGRRLGGNVDARLPSSVLVQMTGNNVRLQDDMPSRIVPCRLNPRMENPQGRKFKRDLRVWALEHRGAVVHAALTIVGAYLRNGAPDVGGGVSRFKDWDRMVRCHLIYAGGANVADTMAAAAEDDEAKNQLREAMDAWGRLFGDREMKAGKVEEELGRNFSEDGTNLRRWLSGDINGHALNSVRIGNRIAEAMGQPVRGRTFMRYLDTKNGGHWLRLEDVDRRPGG